MKRTLLLIVAIGFLSFQDLSCIVRRPGVNKVQELETLSPELRRAYLQDVSRTIFKARAGHVARVAFIVGSASLFLGVANWFFPSLQAGDAKIYIPNPEGAALKIAFQMDGFWGFVGQGMNKIVTFCGKGTVNTVLWAANAYFSSKLLHLMGTYADELIGIGQWNFTLIDFLKQHTELYKAGDVFYKDLVEVLQYTNIEVQKKALDALYEKFHLFMQELCFTDGYVYKKQKQYKAENSFYARHQLDAEYALFVAQKKACVIGVIESLESLKDVSDSAQMQQKVIEAATSIRAHIQQVYHRIEVLSFFMK